MFNGHINHTLQRYNQFSNSTTRNRRHRRRLPLRARRLPFLLQHSVIMTRRIRSTIGNRRRRLLRNTIAYHNHLLNHSPKTCSRITRRTLRHNLTITKPRLIRQRTRRINQTFRQRPPLVRLNCKVKVRRRSNRVKLNARTRLIRRPRTRIKRHLYISIPSNLINRFRTRHTSSHSSLPQLHLAQITS